MSRHYATWLLWIKLSLFANYGWRYKDNQGCGQGPSQEVVDLSWEPKKSVSSTETLMSPHYFTGLSL